MPAETPREEVIGTVIALERACLDADAALTEHRWNDVERAFAEQTRLTDALRLLFTETPELAPLRDARVAKRLRGVLRYREDQLRRLQAYRDELARRLSSVGKMRRLAQTMRRSAARASYVDNRG